jgi:hypothetical protein
VDGYVEDQKDKLVSHWQFKPYKVIDLHLQIFLSISGIQRIWFYHILSNILLLYVSFIKGRRSNIFATRMP